MDANALSEPRLRAYTVAMLCGGRTDSLRTAIAAVLPQLNPNDELLIVDTTAAGTITDQLGQLSPQLRVITFSQSPFDFGAARNFAVQQSRGNIVAFTDDDCIPARNWLTKIRVALADCDAVGGPCMPARPYYFPWWWSGEIAWAIGMSPPALLAGKLDVYPATSNLAASRDLFLNYPFAEKPADQYQLYHGGREDAEWWRNARVSGLRTRVVSDAIVYHDIPPDRLRFRYVLQRVRADGVAFWQRRKSEELRARLAADYVDSLAQIVRSLIKGVPPAIAARLWSQRQAAALEQARKDQPGLEVSQRTVSKLAISAIRQFAADGYYGMRKRLAAKQPWPPALPRQIVVWADTYLGDTVLLRPIIERLANTHAATRILVPARYPDLLTGLPTNVEVGAPSVFQSRDYDAALVPYFSSHDDMWRDHLAARASTFDWDVGFSHRRDYLLARRTMHKQPQLHELQNLQTLFDLWPTMGDLRAAQLVATDTTLEELTRQIPFVSSHPFITIQTSSGSLEKDWPLQRWCELARVIAAQSDIGFVFICNSAESDRVRRCAGTMQAHVAVVDESLSIPAVMLLLSRAKLAIGPCSGPKHLAIALGTPTFTLYGPTEPERWGALSQRHLHAFARAYPSPLTEAEQVGLAKTHAMSLITVETVASQILQHVENLGLNWSKTDGGQA